MAYQVTFPAGTEETTLVGTKYLRINSFDSGSDYLKYRIKEATKIKLATPVGNISYPTQNIDNILGIEGGVLSFTPLENSFLGGDSGSIYVTVPTTPKKSIQSYYPNINTTLKTSDVSGQPGKYWIPCLMNRDKTKVSNVTVNDAAYNTPFIYWGLRGYGESLHGNGFRTVRIPFSSSYNNTGNATGAWQPRSVTDYNGVSFEWVPEFVYPSPLKVKFTASISGNHDPSLINITSSLYLVAQTSNVGKENDEVLDDLGSLNQADRPCYTFNVSSPILISASATLTQEVEFELLLTQSYSRVLDSPIGIPYSKRFQGPRGILPKPLFTDANDGLTNNKGWYLCLYTDNSHSSADNTIHDNGTSPYYIEGGDCQAQISFIFREPSVIYENSVDKGGFDLSENPYGAGMYFTSSRGTPTATTGSFQSYMVIYQSQSFGPDPVGGTEQNELNENLLLTASMFNDGETNQIISDITLTNNWKWVTKIPAIIQTQSAGHAQLTNTEANVVIEPFEVDGTFINNNYNAVIGNALNQQTSEFYKLVEYDNDTVTPSNIVSIQQGTAQRAEVVDSSYSSNSWIRGRYKGTRVSSNNFNTED